MASYFIFLRLLEVQHNRLSSLLHQVCCHITSSVKQRKSIRSALLLKYCDLQIPSASYGDLQRVALENSCVLSRVLHSALWVTRKTWVICISSDCGAVWSSKGRAILEQVSHGCCLSDPKAGAAECPLIVLAMFPLLRSNKAARSTVSAGERTLPD